MRRLIFALLLVPALFVKHPVHGQMTSNDENVTVNKLYQTYDYSIMTDNTFTPVIRYKDAVYFVHCDGNRKPMVGKIQNGQTSVYPLDTHEDYYTRDDLHHMWSISVDKHGYIHILGDMHNFPHSNNKDHLPEEYQDAIILYWVSENPEDVSSFEFVGKDPDRAIPGFAFSYYSFQLDMNQELYMLSRVRVHHGYLEPGINALGLFRYDADQKKWTALGGLAPTQKTAAVYPCVAWEDNGFDDTGGWYQPYRACIRFDYNNRMHLATGVNNNSTQSSNSHILYAYSDDGGETFNLPDGTPIAQLPLRADNVPGQASIVDGEDSFDLFASVSFEQDGQPIVLYTRKNKTTQWGYDNASYRYWDESAGDWSAKNYTPAGGLIKVKYLLDNKGIQTQIDGDPGGKIYRTYDIEESGYKATQLNNRYHGMDEFGIHDSGILTAMTGSNTNSSAEFTVTEVIFDTDLDPLSGLWSVAALGSGFDLEAGQVKEIVEFTAGGLGFTGSQEEMGFMHQSMSGDGEIIARVINVGYQSESSITGVMIRSTNDQSAPMVAAGITYAEGAKMHTRTTEGANVATSTLAQYRCSEWLKITREGDLFTTYRSDNGLDWNIMGSETIEMPMQVQAGCFVSSTVANRTSSAHIDNISISNTITGQQAYTGTSIIIPGVIEAEDYDLGGSGVAFGDTDGINEGGEYRADGVDIEVTTDTDGGYNVGWTKAGEWLEYSIDVVALGVYTFDFRVASERITGAFHVELDGQPLIPTQNVDNTGGWQTWESIVVNDVLLTEGSHVLRVNIDGDSFNLNKITVSSLSTGNTADSPVRWQAYPNPSSGSIQILPPEQGHWQYELLNTYGQVLEASQATGRAVLDLSQLPAGMYVLQLGQGQERLVQRIQIQ